MFKSTIKDYRGFSFEGFYNLRYDIITGSNIGYDLVEDGSGLRRDAGVISGICCNRHESLLHSYIEVQSVKRSGLESFILIHGSDGCC